MAANLFVVFTGKYAGEIAGTIQRAFHLEKFKIEPLLVSNEANPAARFTFGKGLTNNLFLTYSLSLSNSSNQTWIADYSLFRNLSIRALRRDDGSYNTSLRQSWQFGLKLPKEERTKTDSKPTAKVYINNIDFINSIYSKELLSKIIKLEKGSLYNFVAINKSIEELRKFYQQNGYLMVRIIPQKEYVQPDRINLLYSIRPGKKIDLKISNKVPEKKLFNELLELFSRPYNLNYALEEAGRAILYFYKKKGYYKATGKWQIEADDKLKLNYELDKGIKFKKVEPIFEGNKALSSAGLKDIVGYSGSKLIGELYLNLSKIKDKIKLAYAKIGYYFVEINDPIYLYDENKKKLVVKFYLDEKSVSLIKEVMLIGVNKLDRQKIEDEVAMRKGEIFIVEDLYNTVNAIAEIYHNNGYPDALVKFEYKFDNDLNAYVRINVEEGSEAIIDDIEIKGNRLTSTGLIKKQLIFKKGERIDLKKFSTSEDNLYELGVFRKVKIFNQGIEGNSGKQRVYVDVEEIEPFRITYGLRYDSEKKMEYEVELVEQNLFKNAHYTSQRYLKNDTQNDIRFTYGIPSFIRRSWRYDMFVFWQKEEFPSFYTEQWGIALQHQLPINNNVIFQYNYNYKKVHTWEKVTVGPFPFDIEIKVARLISSLIADYRDNKFNPHKGFFYSLEAEFSPRALGSELNFIKIFGQYFNYFQIVQGAVWASSVRVGLANAFDNVLIPSERFFTGGGNSVRGYELNSLGPISPYTGLPMGGEALFVVNQELRFSIYKMISGVLFWDCGNIYKKVKDFNPFDVRQSIGFGLRLDTPLGLIRADIGYKLNKKLQEKPYEVFISLGHMF
jgi:outer membrane protein assembly complex protein YaeT